MSGRDGPSGEEIRRWLVARLAAELGVDEADVDVREPFDSYGLTSAQAVGMSGELAQWLGRDLPATLVWDFPCIEVLARYLAGDPVSIPDIPHESQDSGTGDAIAIVGIGCRFPAAGGPQRFWRLLAAGEDAIREVPADRWDARALYHPDPSTPGRMNTRWGGFVDEVDGFDYRFFGINPREAAAIDPQQRILMEVAWEALEDAGQPPDALSGSRTGVFIGISGSDYGNLQLSGAGSDDPYVSQGNALSIAANRLSYQLDLRGPSLAIDTACSSSLVAVHLACQSLRAGESSLALVGGVNLMLSPAITINFAKAGFMAADGRCKAFDARADGYVRGEGAGIVVLKPLARALSEGDPIYAVIRGTAVNQDGRTNGLTAPSRHAQQGVIREALRRAGLRGGEVDYVEAHGTGTALGDPIEAAALATVVAEDRRDGESCAIGSVKTNIGHLEAAAGVAGLIKVALSLRHGAIPASLHFAEPNPHIPFDTLPIHVQTVISPWPDRERPPIAGVSAFGFGGANAHVVLQGLAPGQRADGSGLETGTITDEATQAQLLTLSARGSTALRDLARAYEAYLAVPDAPSFDDMCRTAAIRRTHHDHRIALVANSAAQARARLHAFAGRDVCAGATVGMSPGRPRSKIAFVFSGQGGQWAGMGRGLIEDEPVFRAVIERCDKILRRHATWSLLGELSAPASSSRLALTEVAQPAIFAVQTALAQLWRSWGIDADAVVGHSMGEVAAAHHAGALSLEDALLVVFHRGRLMQRTAGQGGTIATELPITRARDLVAEHPDELGIAAHNGPCATTLFGDPATLNEVVTALRKEGVWCQALPVDHAFHSPQMEPLQGEFAEALTGIRAMPSSIPIYSTVTGDPIAGSALEPAYWASNLRDMVRFDRAAGSLLADGHEVFVEVAPHPALTVALQQRSAADAGTGIVLPSLRQGQDARSTLLESLGSLYALGHPIDWEGVYRRRGRCVSLPCYPWQHERCWTNVDPGSGSLRLETPDHPSPLGESRHDDMYEVEWQARDPQPDAIGQAPTPSSGWLILADNGDIGEALAVRLEHDGQHCLVVRHDEYPLADPASVERLSGALETLRSQHQFGGVVHLCGLDAPTADQTTTDRLAEPDGLGCASLLNLIKLLTRGDPDSTPRMWVGTRGAQPVGTGEIAPAAAPLWGLGRTLAVEHPALRCTLIDLDPEASASDVLESLLAELRRPGNEDQVAIRLGRRHVPRLKPILRRSPQKRPRLSWRTDASYLITGGLGDLGLAVARWMVQQGARRLVLLSRRELPPRAHWGELAETAPDGRETAAVRELESLGASVHVAPVDVSDHAALAGFLRDFRHQAWPPIRGVVHAAGILELGTLDELSPHSLQPLLAAKVSGGWLLHEEFARGELDFFVCFSSVSTVIGSPRLGAYAAANAFLDGLAHYRRSRGLPALTVNWGPWAEIGMAARVQESADHRPPAWMRPLAPETALRVLEHLLAAQHTQVGVFHLDCQEWQRRRTTGPPILAELIRTDADERRPETGWLRSKLVGADQPSRERILREHLNGAVARALKLPTAETDPHESLIALGVDSLVAFELRNRLEHDLGIRIPLVDFLDGHSITELAARVSEALASAAGVPEAHGVHRGAAATEHSLAYSQRALWFLHHMAPDSAAYHVNFTARIRSDVDVSRLRRAWCAIADRHPTLRSTFPVSGHEPVQRVAQSWEVDFRQVDASACGEWELRQRCVASYRQPFDLQRGPLLRTELFTRDKHDHVLTVTAHHLVLDFWSLLIVLDELRMLYPAGGDSGRAGINPPAITYADYVHWQQDLLASAEGERLLAHWRHQLAPLPPPLELPTDRPRPPIQTQRGASALFTVDERLTDRLRALGATTNTTAHNVLLATYVSFLHRLTGQDAVVVGSASSGRTRAEFETVVGCLVNMLPLRLNVAGDPTFRELVAQVRRTVHAALEHQDLPFGLLVDRLGIERDPARTPLVQAVFSLQKLHRLNELTEFFVPTGERKRIRFGELELEPFAIPQGEGQFELMLEIAEGERSFAGVLKYNTDLFRPETASRLCQAFHTMLAGYAENPEQHISGAPWDPSPDAGENPARQVGTPTAALAHVRFAERAAAAPGTCAVVAGDQRLTYSELAAEASRIAGRLRELGVAPETRVAICLERDPTLIAAVLGVLKSGGAYVPVDPAYPPERVRFMLQDCDAAVALTTTTLATRLGRVAASTICLDEPWNGAAEDGPGPWPAPGRDNLAYIIYTSGSTGTPKGAMVSHANLASSTAARSTCYGVQAPRFLLLSSVAFDSSVAGLFWTLCQGGTLVLAPHDAARDPAEIAHQIATHDISHLLCVPSLYGPILRAANARLLHTLRVVVVAGEECPLSLIELHRDTIPGAALYNEYGPTETTVWTTVAQINDTPYESRVPIGRPIPSARVYVLDARLRPVPAGVRGELYIGGTGVSRGYFNRPGLTAERFLPDPFGAEAGARMYRSGDLCRRLPDGNLEFLGRPDDQVKIHGNRVELGEISATVAQHPAVREAAVVLRDDPGRGQRLVAYLAASGDQRPADRDLRGEITRTLPAFMVPSTFHWLPGLPTGPNGKLDRAALPAPDTAEAEPAREYVPPRTKAEGDLAEIWANVLGVERVGVLDDFFGLGGDSIQSVQVVLRAAEIGLRLEAGQLFQHPTIAELARAATTPTTSTSDTSRSGAPHSYPLTPMQQGMVFHTRYEPAAGLYLPQLSCTLDGDLDIASFDHAWQTVVQRHPVLRTRFAAVDGEEPRQIVEHRVDFDLDLRDWRGLPAGEQAVRLDATAREQRLRGIEIEHAPLMRVALIRLTERSCRLIWTFHHALLDGWSTPVVLDEVFLLYHAERRGEVLELPEPYRFHDYVGWLAEQDLRDAEQWWRTSLSGFTAPTPLPWSSQARQHRPARYEDHAQRERILPQRMTREIRAFTKKHRLTMQILIQGAWALLLSRHSGERDVVFGGVVSGRSVGPQGIERAVGMFLNTLPIRIRVADDLPLVPWLHQLQLHQAERSRYEQAPLLEIYRWSDIPPRSPLFESILVFENPPVPKRLRVTQEPRLGDVRSEARTNYPLSLVADPGDRLSLVLRYDHRRFDATAATVLLEQMEHILLDFVQDPEAAVSTRTLSPSIVDPRDALAKPAYPSIRHMFGEWTERLPGAPAVSRGDRVWTFAELADGAMAVAAALRQNGTSEGHPVAITGTRSFGLVASMLGALCGGAVIVPIDPALPPRRRQLMLRAAGTRCILQVGTGPDPQAGDPTHEIIHVDPDTGHTDPPCMERHLLADPAGDDPAYIFFTSGTTGSPKAVLGCHQGLSHFLAWQKDTFGVAPGDRCAQLTSLSFDVVLRDMLLPLISGATVCLPDLGTDLGADRILPWLGRERISLLHTVPSIASSWLATGAEPLALPDLRLVLFAGEPLTDTLVRKWRCTLAGPADIVNLYGPTETTLAKCWHRVGERPLPGVQPVGRPLPHTQILILDAAGRICAPGEAGEIVIRTPFRTLGYLNAERDETHRFFPNPFRDDPHDLLYRSGDRGRYRPDGSVDVLGRLDNEVKIRGVRVSPDEVAAVLARHLCVAACTVTSRTDALGQSDLFAYVVPNGETAASTLRAYLERDLPTPLIPRTISFIERLPLTPNGKVDHEALPAPATAPHGDRFNPPRTTLERALADLFRDVLSVDRVGREDNFFELGGHSLLATQLMALVRRTFDVELSLSVLFETPTVSALAVAINAAGETGSEREPTPIQPLPRKRRHAEETPESRMPYGCATAKGDPR